jgi:hypothetical protein
VQERPKVHHKHLGKEEDGECFGMLFVPFKYFKLICRLPVLNIAFFGILFVYGFGI